MSNLADIELRLHSIDQLFDRLDPAPFRAKALDRNADAYIQECAGEVGTDRALRIMIYGPDELALHLLAIRSAIHEHFALAHHQAERRHRYRRRIGRIALLAGFATLTAALFLRRLVTDVGGQWADILAEGLLILGWVALWRPIETIAFDSWESREQRRLLARLATIPVEFTRVASSNGTEAI